MLIWVILVIVFCLALTIGVEMLMSRLGIRPVDPDARSGGIRDVAQKVNDWSGRRRSDYADRRSGDRDKR